jgi:hypothetical protein
MSQSQSKFRRGKTENVVMPSRPPNHCHRRDENAVHFLHGRTSCTGGTSLSPPSPPESCRIVRGARSCVAGFDERQRALFLIA